MFIEANPGLAAGLRERFAEEADVSLIEAAASDAEGTATFNITNMNQSSSLLDLKKHAELYPGIRISEQIEVRTACIDELLAENGVDVSAINFLAMDIQGAELMALRGAERFLKGVDAMQLEVNYAHLYDGCALVSELDEFLGGHGFIRIATRTPFNPDWGDGVYVRRPTVGCSSMGPGGTFADDLFRYMFLHSYARDHDYDPVNPRWLGDEIFAVAPGADIPPVLRHAVIEDSGALSASNVIDDADVRPGADFQGLFQFHTRYYRPHRAFLRRNFSFKGAFAERAAAIAERFSQGSGPVACVHLGEGGAPLAWCAAWLADLKKRNRGLTVYLASGDHDARLALKDFNVMTAADLPAWDAPHGFFDDFAAFTLADYVAISDDPLFFAASMLNERGVRFVRPDPAARALSPFDPWNAPVSQG